MSACVIYPFMRNCEIFFVIDRCDRPHVEFDHILLLFTLTRNQVCENERGTYTTHATYTCAAKLILHRYSLDG